MAGITNQTWRVDITPGNIKTQVFDADAGTYTPGPGFATTAALLHWMVTIPSSRFSHWGVGPNFELVYTDASKQQFPSTVSHT